MYQYNYKMNILTTSTGSQELKVIPRYYQTSIEMQITGENSRITETINVSAINTGGYMLINHEFNLDEGLYYGLELFNSLDQLIYRGRIFCTDQTDFTHGRYDTNLGEYSTSDDKDNTIIF